MKTLIRTVSVFMAVAVLLTAAGCGDKADSKAADPAKVADDMLAALDAQGELLEASDSVLDNYYTVDSQAVTAHKVYISTAFIAEEVAVFACADGKEDTVVKMAEQRLQDLKDSFDGYLPEEYASLEQNARILKGGGLVCLLAGSAEGVEAAMAVFDTAVK